MAYTRIRRAWSQGVLAVAVVLVATAASMIALTSSASAQGRQGPPGARAGGGPPPAPVRVDEVIAEPMRQTVPVIGRLVARRSGNVAAQVAGAVQEVQVDVGDRVEQGALLASLDGDALALNVELREAARNEAKAAVARYMAAMSMAVAAVQRLEQLRKSAAFSSARFEDAEQELAQARGSLVEAEARVANAEAQLKLARLQLTHAQIRAPYSGVVTARQAQPGEWLGVGDPVVSMVDDTTLEVEADVPTERIPGLAGDTDLRAVFPSGEEVKARLRAIVPKESAMTRTRAVRFSTELGETGLPHAIDESVTLHVPMEAERMVLTVHKDAINQGPTGPNVFVVEGERAQRRPVELGTAVGPRFVVASGLKPGDKVIVRGNERLQPGQKVSF